jgi:hypothetical protein
MEGARSRARVALVVAFDRVLGLVIRPSSPRPASRLTGFITVLR